MASPDDGERLIARRYRLSSALGQGGMGVVWHGHDTLLNRPIAIKEVVLPPGLPPIERERHLLRTTREARTAARLNHPGIVQIYDVVEEDGRPWIIMELVDAQPLDEIVRLTGPVPVRLLSDIGRQILSALTAAHQAGVLHRDVKPSNILVTEDGRAVLTDFGVATAEGDSSLTQTGMVAGSPSFLAPERASGGIGGAASDLWSFGATLYAGLMGRSPFERADTMETLNAILTEEAVYGRIPKIFHAVLRGLLERDPARRLTAEQADRMLADIQAAQRARDRVTGPPPRVPRPRSKVALAAGVAAVVLAAGAVVVWNGLPRGRGPAADAATSTGPRPVAAATAAPTSSAGPVGRQSATPHPPYARARRPLPIWTSPAGWSIAFPRGWRGSREGAHAEWLRRDGKAHLGVEMRKSAGDDPAKILRAAERLLTPYAREVTTLRRGSVAVPEGRAAEWEFTWTSGDASRAPWVAPGRVYHELRRAVVVDGTAYVLEWTMTSREWGKRRRLREEVFRSFAASEAAGAMGTPRAR
ncbi:serine/threonine protein kinase [Spongiactinospora gelatinilytica]|uniref:non-specific serine/threonine protein kinase n=1 Tax=Spongiactinospora gelatinilytica TaxID=2666298 RepID=A0A2W2H8J6_9ACTN|nr:serine/threonine-protein kinase [Spongiactinospora gelatinilytica]PZG48285.1 serine/threonine protein kinase [Spongiactinospora gelatinilytica]